MRRSGVVAPGPVPVDLRGDARRNRVSRFPAEQRRREIPGATGSLNVAELFGLTVDLDRSADGLADGLD